MVCVLLYYTISHTILCIYNNTFVLYVGVYERAIQELSDADSREICLEYAEVETKLGEVRVVGVTCMYISCTHIYTTS